MAGNDVNTLIVKLMATALQCPAEVQRLILLLPAAAQAERAAANATIEDLKTALGAMQAEKDASRTQGKRLEGKPCVVEKTGRPGAPSAPPPPDTTAALRALQPVAHPPVPPFSMNGPTLLSNSNESITTQSAPAVKSATLHATHPRAPPPIPSLRANLNLLSRDAPAVKKSLPGPANAPPDASADACRADQWIAAAAASIYAVYAYTLA
ncbi:hypothetical protein LTR85_008017 [Meristemomyces frigidus]|nr:hypothetical protein LTR85_008017 [Meristemomyces frigidus]